MGDYWTGKIGPQNNFGVFKDNKFDDRGTGFSKDPSSVPGLVPTTRSKQPIVTGTSVLGIRYKDGVVLAADTLGSYGSMARFRNIERVHKIADKTALAFSGDVSDAKKILEMIEDDNVWEYAQHDEARMTSEEYHAYLTRVMYNRRNKMDPLWNQIVIAGYDNDKPFLGLCDLVGSSYIDNTIATGYGAYIAIPLLRRDWKPDMTKAQAQKLMNDCLRVLFYRDARSLNRHQMATIDKNGVEISKPYALDTNWDWDFVRKSVQGH